MILVLNAGGNIGKELVRELKERGAEFTAAYRSQEDIAAAQAEGMRAVEADFRRPETLDKALSGVQKVFFVSPPVPQLAEWEGNVVRAAERARVAHCVKMSVWGAEEGSFLFAKPHQAVEQQILAAGLPYTFLRPTGFMQNMLGNASSIKSQNAFYGPTGAARVAEIDFRDIAKVAAVVLTEAGHLNKAYELTGGEAMTMAERAQVLSEALGRTISYVAPSDADWKQMMLGYGMPEAQIDGILDLSHYYLAGNSERVSPAVQEITGAPPISYRQFVRGYIEAFRG